MDQGERSSVLSAANIQARIKRGLSRAVEKTGSADIDKVYVVKVTQSGGGSPLDTGTQTSTDVELVNAVFTQYDVNSIGQSDSGGSEIRAGDRRLVCNNDVELKRGETIKHGANKYIIVNVDIKAPTTDVLAYIAQVRAK